jgi:hypothetical protein
MKIGRYPDSGCCECFSLQFKDSAQRLNQKSLCGSNESDGYSQLPEGRGENAPLAVPLPRHVFEEIMTRFGLPYVYLQILATRAAIFMKVESHRSLSINLMTELTSVRMTLHRFMNAVPGKACDLFFRAVPTLGTISV